MQYRSLKINPATGVASAQGIDVSNYQGTFDWVTAARQVPNLAYGFFRLTEGLPGSHDNSPDPFAAHNRSALHDAGLVQGAYHFLHPSLSGKDQAQYCVDEYVKLGLYDVDMFALDTEATDGEHPDVIASCAAEFMAELDTLRPHNPKFVYSNFNFANMGADFGLGKYPLWLAWPGTKAPQAPAPWNNWAIWQWGTRPAVGKTVDADAFNGTVDDFRTFLDQYNLLNPVHNLRVIKRGFTGFNIEWDKAPGATSYTARAWKDRYGGTLSKDVETTTTGCRLGMLRPGHEYVISVRAHPGLSRGRDAMLHVKTRG